MYEDDLDYASRRLNETLVRLSTGEPFYITRTYFNNDNVMVHLGTNLNNNEKMEVKHSDVDLEPVPLGFVNTSSDMIFVSRKPMRRDWKQGLSRNAMSTYGRLSPQDINLKLLCQPIMQRYPSFSRALTSLEKKSSVAFSRDFGLSKQEGGIKLVYRKHEVGEVIDGNPSLFPTKIFLQEHLMEIIG